MILCDPAAERAVLAGICSYGENAYLDIADIIQETSFTVDSNTIIFKCLKQLCESHQSIIDLASIYSVSQELGFSHILSKKEETQHLKAIMDFPVSLDNVRKFAAKIRKLEIARLLRKQLELAQDKILEVTGAEPISSIIGLAEDSIFNFTSLLNDTDNNPEIIGSTIDEYIKNLEENKIDQVGIPTGFPIYDQAIGGGLRKGTINVIGARPKAQPLTAKILTPSGWKTMGDIKIGDILVSPGSHLATTKVVGIYPQGIKSSYRFTFNDGSKTEACIEHLWKIKHKTWAEFRVLSYREITQFRLPDDEWEVPSLNNQSNNKSLKNVIYVGEKQMQCIKVENPNGLYVTDDYIVTHNTGKTLLSDNMGINVAKLGIPVLNMDTEMNKEDHINRILAMMSEIEINTIETGKFADSPDKKNKIAKAASGLKSLKLYHKSIAGKPFEDQLAIMRRWLVKDVGLNDDGTAKECVIFYDYLKLMDSAGISQDLKEYQVLGFMMTSLHNFAVRYKVPIVAFIQLNRDGITKESTDSASGSDRIIWLCSNFSIFKRKSDEEIAEDGPDGGNRKLIPLISRHGGGLDDNDYINCHMKGWCAKITEGKTHLEIKHNIKSNEEGFIIDEDDDEENQIPFE